MTITGQAQVNIGERQFNSSNISMLGSIVMWKLASFDRTLLQAELKAIGLARYLPKERTNNSALKAALITRAKHLSSSGTRVIVVHPDKTKGHLRKYELVRVDSSNGGRPNDYTTLFSVLVPTPGTRLNLIPTQRADGTLASRPFPCEHEQEELRKLSICYDREKETLGPSKIGRMLSTIVTEQFNGIRIGRPAGGVYHMQEDYLPTWWMLEKALIASVRFESGQVKLYNMQVKRDKEALTAVLHAICRRVENRCHDINKDLAEGDLGKRALNNRQDEAVAMKKQIEQYERLLGRPLSNLHDMCNQMKAVAAEALLSKLD